MFEYYSRLFFILGVFFLCLQQVQPVCYYPNGDTTPGDIPCDDSKSQSTCCGAGYACLSNNICMKSSSTVDKNSEDTYVRGSCTDQSWRSSNCPNFCVRAEDPYNDMMAGGEGMAKCNNTEVDMYYCINANMDAVNCSAQQNVLVFPGSPVVLTIAGVAASSKSTTSSSTFSLTSSLSTTTTDDSSSSSATTSTVSSTSDSPDPITSTREAPTSSPAETNSGSNRVAIGSGVGVGVGVIILGLVALFLYRRHSKKTRERFTSAAGTPLDDPVVAGHGHSSVQKSELPAHEVNNFGVKYELQADH